MSEDLYEILGLDKDASEQEIRDAYKREAMLHHPDKTGGDDEQFKKVNHAKQLLLDPARRDRYDRTGKEDETPFDKRFYDLIQSAFMQLLDAPNFRPERDDPIHEFKKVLREMIRDIEGNAKESERQVKKMEKLRDRFSRSKEGPNKITMIMDIRIEQGNKNIALCADEVEFYEEAITALLDYDFELIVPPVEIPQYTREGFPWTTRSHGSRF